MNFKNIFYALALAAGASVTLHSCDLDEYNPSAGDASLTAFNAWSGLSIKCYEPLYSQMFSATDYLSVAETGTDMWLVTKNGTSTKELFYYEGLTTGTNGTNKVFLQCYSMITNCNTVINEAANLVDVNGREDDVRIIVGEAKFLRALYYSILVTHYGPVTLNLEGVDVVDMLPKRSSEAAIYKQIVQDLKDAASALEVEPYGGNYGRATKKAALGLLARVYAQGGGLGLSDDDGVSYWELARRTAEDLITNAAAYGAYLYPDVADLWADANNRNNKEALFLATGPQPGTESFQYASGANKLFAYMCGNPGSLSEFWNKNHKPSDKGYFYGRMNASTYMPSKYLMDCFDPSWDKRWENTFIYGYSEWSMVQCGWVAYDKGKVKITQEIIDKYKLNPNLLDEYYYPYADCDGITYEYGGNQYPAKRWKKGSMSGNLADLEDVKKIYVVDYPIDKDDERFNIVCYKGTPEKPRLTLAEKQDYRYFIVNIADLYRADGRPHEEPFDKADGLNSGQGTNAYTVYPSVNKFNWSYEGVFNGGNLQVKNGDMFVQRMGEIYLIAAEANVVLGNGGKAAGYLNTLRDRAVRPGLDSEDYHLGTATLDDVFDEYARELCGEFSRWALLKRHHAFESRLQQHNIRAYESFDPSKHYYRPISQSFLTQISNKEEYGDNGYGTTAHSGMDGFVQK